jgi:hypothetical protein
LDNGASSIKAGLVTRTEGDDDDDQPM